MSQKKRLEILRCEVLLKVFSKKRSFLVQKTRPLLLSETILNQSRPGTLCSAGTPVAVCYDSATYSPPILPGLVTAVLLFRRTSSGFEAADKLLLPARNEQILPGLPKSAFIKNEQKAKTKTFLFQSKGATVWPLKFTADSPPFFHGRLFRPPPCRHLAAFHLAGPRMA
jgi:hypothetical protein